MNLARFSVKRPVAATIISVAIFVIGIFNLKKISVALYPEVTLPFVAVTIPLPGANAEQMEKKIVKPLEKEMAGIGGVKRVFSIIRPSQATIVVAFNMSVDQREAVNNVRERASKLKATFPKDTKEPIVTRVDLGSTPVLIYGIESDLPASEVKKILDDHLIPALQRVDGVNEAEVAGLGDKEVEVSLDPERLAPLRVAPLDVFQQLSTHLSTIPWGDIDSPLTKLAVSSMVRPQDPVYWDDHQLTLADGRSIRLGEIGKTRITNDNDVPLVKINGKQGLGLVITKKADGNTVETVKNVKRAIKSIPLNKKIRMFEIIDQSKYIKATLHEVWVALFAGGAFAVLVILFFLTDVKSAIITATALPVSVAGTFILMNYLGFTINMISLISLALAIGLLIDDAVVVRESIFSQIEKGVEPREAAVKGTDKVANAVLATTLAVVAVFLPISVMEGVVGQFFKEFGMTIIFAVVISLWVAFTLDPLMSVTFGGAYQPIRGAFWDKWRGALSRVEVYAKNVAGAVYRRPVPIIVTAVALLILSIWLAWRRGADFLPFEDRGQLMVNIIAKVGSSQKVKEALADDAYQRLTGLTGLTHVYAAVGSTESDKIEMRLVFVDKTKRKVSLKNISSEVRDRLKDIDGDVLVVDPPVVEGVGAETPLSIYIYGQDLKALFAEADRIVPLIRAIPGVAGLYLETAHGAPGYDVSIKQSEAGFYGTNQVNIELTGRIALTGLEAGTVGEDNLPLYLRYPEEKRSLKTLSDLTYVPTPKGPILMNQLTTFKESINSTHIDRENRSRKVIIRGAMDRTRSYGNIVQDVEKILTTIKYPMSAQLAGDKEFFDEMVNNFSLAIIGSGFFIFVILAIQFENVLRPFIILLTLPLAAIGAFIALIATNNTLSLGSLIGIVLLIGLAAKNGILLVDAIGVKEKLMPQMEAVEASVLERFRPIVMTSVTMIFGMIPTAVMKGPGSEIRAPMALAIIGGVITSTILTLVVVPAIFGLMAKMGRKSGYKKGGVAAAAMFFLGTLFFSFSSAKAVEQNFSNANMQEVIRFLKTYPKKESKEYYTIQAADVAAKGATLSSWLAFAGGLKVEAERQWAKPGIVNSFTLSLPPQMGGAQTINTTILPEQQDVLTIGWTIPLFNLQVIQGLEMAKLTREQKTHIDKIQLENFARSKAMLMLQYELAVHNVSLQSERIQVAATRYSTAKAKYAAGLVRRGMVDEAEASLAAGKAELERAKTEVIKLKTTFLAQSGQELPAQGFGLFRFPFMHKRPFNPLVLKVLDSTAKLHEQSVSIVDAGYYPTLDLTAAHQEKEYGAESPDPQNLVSVKLSWLLLDGGTRRRNRSESLRTLYQSKADLSGMRLELKTAYDTMPTRMAGLQQGLIASKAALRAAEQAVNDASSSFQSGTGKLIDVRTADEARLGARLAVYQAELGLQALALESLVLSGQFLKYVYGIN
jgi:multidrug efflux pump subunit AcrB